MYALVISFINRTDSNILSLIYSLRLFQDAFFIDTRILSEVRGVRCEVRLGAWTSKHQL